MLVVSERGNLRQSATGDNENIDGVDIKLLHNGLKGGILRRDISTVCDATSALDRAGRSILVWRELFRGVPECVMDMVPLYRILRNMFGDWKEKVENQTRQIELSFRVVEARVIIMDAAMLVACCYKSLLRESLIRNAVYYNAFHMRLQHVMTVYQRHGHLAPDWLIEGLRPGGARYGLVALYIIARYRHLPPEFYSETGYEQMLTFFATITCTLCAWGHADRLIAIIDNVMEHVKDPEGLRVLREAWAELDATRHMITYKRDRALLVAMFEKAVDTREPEEDPAMVDLSEYMNNVAPPKTVLERWIDGNAPEWESMRMTPEGTIDFYGMNATAHLPPNWAYRETRDFGEIFYNKYAGLLEPYPQIQHYVYTYEASVLTDPYIRRGVRGRIRFVKVRIETGRGIVPQFDTERLRSSGDMVSYDQETNFRGIDYVWMGFAFFDDFRARTHDSSFFITDPKQPTRNFDVSAKPDDYKKAWESAVFKSEPDFICPPLMWMIGPFRSETNCRRMRRINMFKKLVDPNMELLMRYKWSDHRSTINEGAYYSMIQPILPQESPQRIYDLTEDIIRPCWKQWAALFIARFCVAMPIFIPASVVLCMRGVDESIEYFLYSTDDFMPMHETPIREFDLPFVRDVLKDRKFVEDMLDAWLNRIQNSYCHESIAFACHRVNTLREMTHRARARALLTYGISMNQKNKE